MPKVKWKSQDDYFWYADQGPYLTQVFKHSFKVSKSWRWEVRKKTDQGMVLVKGDYTATLARAKTMATRTANKIIEGYCPHCLGTGRR